jgi:hypothetical protein
MQTAKGSSTIGPSSLSHDRAGKDEPSIPSPTKKKVYTVARPLPAGSTLDLLKIGYQGAPSDGPPSVSKEEIKIMLAKHIRRDNNGKIMIHAGLGNKEDLAQLDEYLAMPVSTIVKPKRARKVSKTGTNSEPSRSMLTDTSSNISESQGPENPCSTTKNTSKSLNLEYKKMLRQMPIHERISMEREKNVLLNWEKRNR